MPASDALSLSTFAAGSAPLAWPQLATALPNRDTFPPFGSAFFPGGMGEFLAPQNEFLVFEEGPSVDIRLQWATYRDAADECSLSRIYGGIHPTADDIPGRLMGAVIGIEAYQKAEGLFGKPQEVLDRPTVLDKNLEKRRGMCGEADASARSCRGKNRF